jgi:hypothetical protein
MKRKSPMPLEQVAAIKAEADRRYKDDPKSAYGSAHVVGALCDKIQRMAEQITRLKRKQQHAQQH